MPDNDAPATAKAKATASKKSKSKHYRDAIRGISNGAIDRLLHQAGVKTMSRGIYDDVRGVLKLELENAIQYMIHLMKSDKRKTILPEDVLGYFETLATVYPTGFEDRLSKCKTYEQERANRAEQRERAKKKKDGTTKATTTRRKARHPQALRKIRFYQKQHDCVIFAKLVFSRLVHEISIDYSKDVRWSADALGLLQIAIETHLREIFENSLVAALHSKRMRVQPKDLQLARRLNPKF